MNPDLIQKVFTSLANVEKVLGSIKNCIFSEKDHFKKAFALFAQYQNFLQKTGKSLKKIHEKQWPEELDELVQYFKTTDFSYSTKEGDLDSIQSSLRSFEKTFKATFGQLFKKVNEFYAELGSIHNKTERIQKSRENVEKMFFKRKELESETENSIETISRMSKRLNLDSFSLDSEVLTFKNRVNEFSSYFDTIYKENLKMRKTLTKQTILNFILLEMSVHKDAIHGLNKLYELSK